MVLSSNAIDSRALKYFAESVLNGSIRAAADKLDMNPSVISRQITQLEASLSVRLLERHGRGVKPTLAGQFLMDFHHKQRLNFDEMMTRLDEVRRLSRGHIELVVGEGYVSDLTTLVMRHFWQTHPNLTISLHVAGTNDLMRYVEDDLAQIGLVYNPTLPVRLRSVAAIRQPMCAIVPPDHPILEAGRPSISLEEVARYPVAQLYSSYGIRQILDRATHSAGIVLNINMTTNSMAALKDYVRSGAGISIFPAVVASREIKEKKLYAVPIDQPLLAATEAHVIARSGRQLPAVTIELMRLLIKALESFGPH
jgi:DNA-binding transcriptional LysR family regulator